MEEVAQKRLKICRDCEFHSTNAKAKGYHTYRFDDHCTNCGCTLATKARAMGKGCPVDKWPAILSDKEDEDLSSIKK